MCPCALCDSQSPASSAINSISHRGCDNNSYPRLLLRDLKITLVKSIDP